MNIQPYFSLILAGLFIFGLGFNWLIAWSERHHVLDGYTAFAVVLGTLVTLGGIALINLTAAVIALACFAASGLPMLAGSVYRHIEARRKEREYERQTQAVAERSKRG